MQRTASLLTIILLASLMIAFGQKRAQKPRVNHAPEISSFWTSTHSISLCPFFPCAPAGAEIARLILVATDADGDALKFECIVPLGKLSGCGPSMSWDLNNVLRGRHSIVVEVTDGHGGEAKAELAVTVQDCGICDPPPPPCPIITISCPQEIEAGKRLVCSVNLAQDGPMKKWAPMSEEELYKRATFSWRVKSGEILKGQRTREIEVDTKGAEQQIRVTIEVLGFDPACSFQDFRTVAIKKSLP